MERERESLLSLSAEIASIGCGGGGHGGIGRMDAAAARLDQQISDEMWSKFLEAFMSTLVAANCSRRSGESKPLNPVSDPMRF